jgi:hypothetical protein
MRGVCAMPCRAAVSVSVSPVAARSARARARAPACRPRVAPRLVRTRAAESDGGSPDDDNASASSESLFTPEFSAAFRAAQERLEAKEASDPERARINDEVAQIIARVEAERELEAALPVEDDTIDEQAEAAKSEKRQEVEEAYAAKLDNPLFTPEFKQAFIEAQERIAERNAPMMAKINDEVKDIMAQVEAEREAAARGENVDKSRPLRARGGDAGDAGDAADARAGPGPAEISSSEIDSTLGSLFGGALDPSVPRKPPAPLPVAPPPPAASPDAEVLLQMKQVSQAQIDRLQASLAAIEGAVLAEQMQLQRIEFAIAKAAREARYAEADRVARERRERAEGEDER